MRTLPSNLRLIYTRVYLHKIKLTAFPKVKQWQSQKEKSENICLSGENREITYLFRQTFLSSYTSLSLKIAFGNCTHGSRKLHKGDRWWFQTVWQGQSISMCDTVQHESLCVMEKCTPGHTYCGMTNHRGGLRHW